MFKLCPKCKDHTNVIDWYTAEDMVKTGIDGAFTFGLPIIRKIFSPLESLFGKRTAYRCTKCDHVFYFSNGSLMTPCAICGNQLVTLAHGPCCNGLYCQKCNLKMWAYGTDWASFTCGCCGHEIKESASAEEIAALKSRHDERRKRLA